MRIVWICNSLIADVALKHGLPLKKPESWISGLYNVFLNQLDYKITYCFPFQKQFEEENNNFRFLSFPPNISKKLPKRTKQVFESIFLRTKPDVVHIFGTEFPHTLYALEACQSIGILHKCVIHIQGLVSFIASHNNLCLPNSIINGVTLRDLVKRSSVKHQIASFKKRGELEIKSIKIAKHFIGRTDWDKSVIDIINPSAKYYSCDEILRDSFYINKWSIEECEKYSIFVAQSNYSLKGFHVVLKAIHDIEKKYPDLKVYTTGKNLLDKRWFSRIKLTRYQKFIVSLIKKYGLENKVFFLGYLDEQSMCDRIKKSHVSILSSFLENSPNSLCESMILGTPTISSYVGGVSSIFRDKIDGLCYPCDEPELLSFYLGRIFDDDFLAKDFSKNAKAHASIRHDRRAIFYKLIDIYACVAEEKKD